jgi:hypothetical protein
MKSKKLTSFTASLIGLLVVPLCSGGDWQELLNGEDLTGWEVKGWSEEPGVADFYVEDGMIVGVSTAGVPNSFLCPEATYGDFILEFDVLTDIGMNSGVQFRSLSDPDYLNGRVHGYQVEIDTASRAWSGGVYDEKRRGWLYPLSRNEKGRSAFRNGEWNHYRVEAIGPLIRVWVNGIQCTNLVDDMTAEGFIGLQVHAIKGPEQEGLTVRWKNLKILTEDLEANLTPLDPDVPVVNWMKNTLSEQEIRLGWRFLFDGKTTDGWRRANDTVFPEAGWVVDDGLLSVVTTGGGESASGGDIVTLEEFSSFELELDFNIEPGANSGIKYAVVEGLNKGTGSAIGLEFQVLDNALHPDAKLGVGGNRTMGSLYDLIASKNLSEGRTSAMRVNPPGEWNKARLVVRGNHVEHWLNNLKVVEYERGTQIFRSLVAKSKYSGYQDFGEAVSGHLLLQEHGHRVSYRSIKIREFQE